MSRARLEVQAQAQLQLRQLRAERNTTYGIVCPQRGFLYALTKKGAKWKQTAQDVDIYLPAKLEKVLTSIKRFICVIGGRGSAKSVGIADICVGDAKDNDAKSYFVREYQSSIKNSVHSLIGNEIKRFGFPDFTIQNQSILYKDQPAFEFTGLARNVDSVKSSHGFSRFVVEESQFITQKSLSALTPTVRNKPKNGLPSRFVEPGNVLDSLTEAIAEPSAQVIFIANPGSVEDPFSKRFIVPFQGELDRNGIYEDDLHLIVVMNYTDNPWYEDSGLEAERAWDKQFMAPAFYEHQWLGKYNDSVDNSLILAEWFDACVDAHKKLGFVPRGAKVAAHDPSDKGPDSKGYVMRHGSVVLDVQEKLDGDVNEGGHWACGLAQQQSCDYYNWDADGMGVALNEQTSTDFGDKLTVLCMFKGSESPDFPEAIYKPAQSANIYGQKTNADTFRNKRAQYYSVLRDRIYRTYRYVVHGEHCDIDTLISFDSDIALLSKLRAELCRMPIKPNGNGLIELFTKVQMLTKFKIASPNLADALMMSMRVINPRRPAVKLPQPLRPMGRRR